MQRIDDKLYAQSYTTYTPDIGQRVIPHEIFHLIISLVDTTKDKLNLALVSKKWQEISSNNVFWMVEAGKKGLLVASPGGFRQAYVESKLVKSKLNEHVNKIKKLIHDGNYGVGTPKYFDVLDIPKQTVSYELWLSIKKQINRLSYQLDKDPGDCFFGNVLGGENYPRDLELLKISFQFGANLNLNTGNLSLPTLLFLIARKFAIREFFELMIDHGADVFIANNINKTAVDLNMKYEDRTRIKKYAIKKKELNAREYIEINRQLDREHRANLVEHIENETFHIRTDKVYHLVFAHLMGPMEHYDDDDCINKKLNFYRGCANAHLKLSSSDIPSLLMLCFRNFKQNIKIIELLLDLGADPNISLQDEESPSLLFHIKKFQKDIRPWQTKDLFKRMIEAGADIFKVNAKNQTALDFIGFSSHDKEELLAYHASLFDKTFILKNLIDMGITDAHLEALSIDSSKDVQNEVYNYFNNKTYGKLNREVCQGGVVEYKKLEEERECFFPVYKEPGKEYLENLQLEVFTIKQGVAELTSVISFEELKKEIESFSPYYQNKIINFYNTYKKLIYEVYHGGIVEYNKLDKECECLFPGHKQAVKQYFENLQLLFKGPNAMQYASYILSAFKKKYPEKFSVSKTKRDWPGNKDFPYVTELVSVIKQSAKYRENILCYVIDELICNKEDLKYLDFMIKLGANPNIYNENHLFPLFYMARKHLDFRREGIDKLIAAGADINQKTRWGQTYSEIMSR